MAKTRLTVALLCVVATICTSTCAREEVGQGVGDLLASTLRSQEVAALGIEAPVLPKSILAETVRHEHAKPIVLLHLTRTGIVYSHAPEDEQALRSWALASDDVDEQRAALAALAAFVSRVPAAASEGDSGSPKGRLLIHADKSATWKYAFWLLSLAFSPERGTGMAEFVVRADEGRDGGGARTFPVPWGVRSDPTYPSGLQAKALSLDDSDWVIAINAYRMGWRDPARSRTRIKLQPGWMRDLPGWALETNGRADALARVGLLEELEAEVLAQVGRAPPGAHLRGMFSTPPPKGPNVPVGDALAMLQTLRAHMEGPIVLEGITLPGAGDK